MGGPGQGIAFRSYAADELMFDDFQEIDPEYRADLEYFHKNWLEGLKGFGVPKEFYDSNLGEAWTMTTSTTAAAAPPPVTMESILEAWNKIKPTPEEREFDKMIRAVQRMHDPVMLYPASVPDEQIKELSRKLAEIIGWRIEARSSNHIKDIAFFDRGVTNAPLSFLDVADDATVSPTPRGPAQRADPASGVRVAAVAKKGRGTPPTVRQVCEAKLRECGLMTRVKRRRGGRLHRQRFWRVREMPAKFAIRFREFPHLSYEPSRLISLSGT